jgi:hypothetical protein
LLELIRQSDLVITDTSSGTCWSEVLALKKPLLLYNDPDQVRLLPHFASDLERACCWCKTTDLLLSVVRQLAAEGDAFVDELRQIDTSVFLRQYVLGLNDGRAVERVAALLNSVCRQGQPLQIVGAAT